MNPLPPQAYTQDTLVKAFAWLQTQPLHIKETAITSDILVSLYLKAQRQGEEALDRPSIHNFRKELKSLAGMMGEFEGEKPPMTEGATSARPAPSRSVEPKMAPTGNKESLQTKIQPMVSQPLNNQSPSALTALETQGPLDEKSRMMIHEVMTQFNLSSEKEAVRLLISVGYHQLKPLAGR